MRVRHQKGWDSVVIAPQTYPQVAASDRLVVAESVSEAGRQSAASRVPQPRRSNWVCGTSTSDFGLLVDLKGVIHLEAEYLTGDSSLECPGSSCTARRLLVR